VSLALGTGESTVIDTYAVIPGDVADRLVTLLGSWTRSYMAAGMPHDGFLQVSEAIDALREAADRASRRGSGEVAAEAVWANLEAGWLSTAAVAEASGVTPRRVRQLREQGRLEGRMVGRRLCFPETAPARVRALRRTSPS
jgi:hypothetical protein